jgi:hypothetical protein
LHKLQKAVVEKSFKQNSRRHEGAVEDGDSSNIWG